jgi:hypothetical protein
LTRLPRPLHHRGPAVRDDGGPGRRTLRICARADQPAGGWITPRGGSTSSAAEFITDYFLDNETNGDQANFLPRQLYRGDWRRAAAFVDELRAVSPDDIRGCRAST